MNFDSFSHGQIKSKLWLCETLEPYIKNNSRITIFGSWHNILGFMLKIRNNVQIDDIVGVDIDSDAKIISDKICDYWIIENQSIKNITNDVNLYNTINSDVIINCSTEHIEGTDWFTSIPYGTLVCLQSSNILQDTSPWFVKNPNKSLEIFSNKYLFSETLFEGTLDINYNSWGYKRFMIIGIK